MPPSPPPAAPPPAAPPPPPPAAAPPPREANPPAAANVPKTAAAPPAPSEKIGDEGGAKANAAQGKAARETKVKVVTLDHQRAALGILVDKMLTGSEIMVLLKEEFPELKLITDVKAVTRLLEAVKNFLSRVFKKQECFVGREQCFQCLKFTKQSGENKNCDTLHPTIKARSGYTLTCSDIKKPVTATWGLVKETAGGTAAETTPGKRSRAEGSVDENPETKKPKEEDLANPT